MCCYTATCYHSPAIYAAIYCYKLLQATPDTATCYYNMDIFLGGGFLRGPSCGCISAIYVSWYCFICLDTAISQLCMCPDTGIYCYRCVLILLYMCRQGQFGFSGLSYGCISTVDPKLVQQPRSPEQIVAELGGSPGQVLVIDFSYRLLHLGVPGE